MNANLTRDAFFELLDFIDEPDDDTAGNWTGLGAPREWTCVCGKNHAAIDDQLASL
jgi:hypothetical protein